MIYELTAMALARLLDDMRLNDGAGNSRSCRGATHKEGKPYNRPRRRMPALPRRRPGSRPVEAAIRPDGCIGDND